MTSPQEPTPLTGHGPLMNSTGLAKGWTRMQCDCGWESEPQAALLHAIQRYGEHVTDAERAKVAELEETLARTHQENGDAIIAICDEALIRDRKAAEARSAALVELIVSVDWKGLRSLLDGTSLPMDMQPFRERLLRQIDALARAALARYKEG